MYILVALSFHERAQVHLLKTFTLKHIKNYLLAFVIYATIVGEWVGQKRSKSCANVHRNENCVKLEMKLVEQMIQQLCEYHTERAEVYFW